MKQARKTNDIVSMRQLAMIYIITGFSPAIRFLPSYTAQTAKEAGWVSPFAAIVPIGLTLYFLHILYNKLKDKSTFEIITGILGKYFGNLIIMIHLLWVFFLLAFYARLNGERLVGTVYPNISITFFIVVTLIIISYVLRSGATALARMGEFLTPILILLFTFVTIFILPMIRIDALLPVYFNDIIPILKASVGTISLFSYCTIVLMFSENIVGRKHTASIFSVAAVVYFTIIVLLLIMSIGLLGSSVTARSANPFLIMVKQISILDTIENIESIVIAMWLLSDSILIATMAIVVINIMKYFFRLSDPRGLINIILVFTMVFSLGIAASRIELD